MSAIWPLIDTVRVIWKWLPRPAWWVTRNEEGDVIAERCHLVTCPNYSYLGQCVHASASSQTQRMSSRVPTKLLLLLLGTLVKHEQWLLRHKWETEASCLGRVPGHDLAMRGRTKRDQTQWWRVLKSKNSPSICYPHFNLNHFHNRYRPGASDPLIMLLEYTWLPLPYF